MTEDRAWPNKALEAIILMVVREEIVRPVACIVQSGAFKSQMTYNITNGTPLPS